MGRGLLKNQPPRQSIRSQERPVRQTLPGTGLLDRTPSVHTFLDPTQLLDILLSFIEILI